MYFFGPDRTDERLAAAKAALDQALGIAAEPRRGALCAGAILVLGLSEYARAQAELDLGAQGHCRKLMVGTDRALP
jgi:hypothetical protein